MPLLVIYTLVVLASVTVRSVSIPRILTLETCARRSQGVVRVENLEDATEHVPTVLERVKPEYLVRGAFPCFQFGHYMASLTDCDLMI